MKQLLKHILAIALCSALSWHETTAQEVDHEVFDYRDFKFYKEEEEEDITLWGGLYKQPEEEQGYHHIPQYRYAISYATNRYRGFNYSESRNSFGALTIDYETSNTLRSLGYESWHECGIVGPYNSGALAECNTILLGTSSRLYDHQTLRVDLSGRNYLLGITYRGVYNIPKKGLHLKEGWSIMTSARTRTGRDIYVDGVYTNALNLALGASYNDRNTNLEIAVSLPCSERGLRQASTQEAYTLTHNRLYNPTWGIQSGKIRNARVAKTLRPELVALWRRKITAVSTLTIATNLYYEHYGTSTLTWFNSPTPIPDNYKYLPSYYSDSEDRRTVEEVWLANDLRYTQIDWESLYHTNSLTQDGHAIYAISSRRSNTLHSTINIGLNSQIKDVNFEYGIELHANRERCFRVIDDMLGARHIVDHDYYIEDDATYSHLSENNLRNPDNIISEGDKYSYDYHIARLGAKLYGTAKWNTAGVDFIVGANMMVDHAYRRGYFEKELFPISASYGRSMGMTLVPATLSTSASYSLNRHTMTAAVMLRGESPKSGDIFLQPEYNNRLIDNPAISTAIASELIYAYTTQRVRLQAKLFIASTAQEVNVLRYYDDLAREYVDAVVRGIGRLHYGVEFDSNIRWSKYFSSDFAITIAQYRYRSNPYITAYADDDNGLIYTTTAEMKGCYTGAPQLTMYGDVTFRYNGWMARASANFWGLNHATPSPIRRTLRIVSYAASAEEAEALIYQEQLPNVATLNLDLAKRIKFSNKTSLNIQLSARNILGSNVVYSSKEDNRVSIRKVGNRTNVAPFANRMLYAYPFLFSLSASLWF